LTPLLKLVLLWWLAVKIRCGGLKREVFSHSSSSYNLYIRLGFFVVVESLFGWPPNKVTNN
jgi:hypothetical protein